MSNILSEYTSNSFLYLLFVFALLLGWLGFSLYYIIKAKSDFKSINHYILDSIPSVFTTLGLLGTFIGIAVGLIGFDTDPDKWGESVQILLDGLRLAFLSSIAGISLSLISCKFIEAIQYKNEKIEESRSELGALNKLIEITVQYHDDNKNNFDMLKKVISSDSDESLSTHLLKLRTSLREQNAELKLGLDKVFNSLGSDEETSLLTQIQKLRVEQFEISSNSNTKIAEINETIKASSELTRRKFDEFTTLLEEISTKALVQAIQNVIGGFNDKLTELIEKLVKENFEELNNSVKNLNDWQRENKVQIETLITQFKDVSSNLQISSKLINQIAESTDKLTNSDSILLKLIKELEETMVDNTLFKDSVKDLKATTEIINQSSTQFNESSKLLNEWVEKEKSFKETINNLIDRLKEIELLRDQAGKFWDDVKVNMKEGVDIIKGGNEELMSKVRTLESAFNQRLNDSFTALDKVLQAMVLEYAERMNEVK